MSQAIAVEKVSKKFVLGALQRDTMLRERLISMLSAPFRRRSAAPNVLWALPVVSFGSEAGEVVGPIGRMGAGRSPLLKVLPKSPVPLSVEVDVWVALVAL